MTQTMRRWIPALAGMTPLILFFPFLSVLSILSFAGGWPPDLPAFTTPDRASALAASAPVCPAGPSVFREEALRQTGFAIQDFVPSQPAELPLPADDLDRASAVLAARRTQGYWEARTQDKVVLGGRPYAAAQLSKSFAALANLLETIADPKALQAELSKRFDVYKAVTASGVDTGLITAYFDPEIAVSASATAEFTPLYARPADLIAVDPAAGLSFDYGRKDETGRLVPYYSRAEISRGALSGRGLELYWTRHPTDLMVLQTQGSGWAVLPDGRRVRLDFDGANGRPFMAVGQQLIDCGLIPAGADPDDVLSCLKSQTPEREAALVDLDPRYVFFKTVAGSPGPMGFSGLELIAGRSIAVDPAMVPMGMAGLLVSHRPVADESGKIVGQKDFTRFVFTHDTGSAIRGPVRVDLFMGSGAQASAEAHHMMFPGRLFLFVLKEPQP